MSKRQNIESLDHLLRDLCDSNLIFGGKVVVFGGDFRQTLPILPRKSQREIVEASLFSSHLWPKLIKFSLTENLRAKDDPEFAQFLLALGQAVTYTSYDSMLDDTCAVYPAEFINKLNPGGMSPHKLVLKVNCPVILIRNLQPSFGLCNGTRLICKRFLPNTIECVIMTGQHKGDCVLIPRIKLRPAPSTNYPFQFQRNQFPLKLSFAMTVNKCQGQTLS
ncbi:uncharacterized protein LOC141654976 [Silene latifolia]|uniref:uncharacterized protein LOC141654976 n=1 Tax=Silene latifolia TaxID=37657 RepID=UPI003D78A378